MKTAIRRPAFGGLQRLMLHFPKRIRHIDRSIDVCIGRLRKKLNDDPRNPAVIRTVRNGGYIFSARVAKH